MTPPDLSKLPPPEVVAQPDYETVLAALTAEFRERWPEYDATVESDPVRKLLEVFAWRETVLRRQVADAARAVMLAYAGGADLDHLAALLAVSRRAGESDEELRDRVRGAPGAASTAGPAAAYRHHARAVPGVADAGVSSPAAGTVRVVVLGTAAGGVPPQPVLTAVSAALGADEVRPLTDTVQVRAAAIVSYDLTAELEIADGPDAGAVLAAAEASARAYAAERGGLGQGVPRSGLYAALHVGGVEGVTLTAPAADVAATAAQAARLDELTLTKAA